MIYHFPKQLMAGVLAGTQVFYESLYIVFKLLLYYTNLVVKRNNSLKLRSRFYHLIADEYIAE
jgi:hypothetical protein